MGPQPEIPWDQKTRDAFVPGKEDLLFTSVHEVMPGHFVQFLHANRSPSIFGRISVGYAYAEGWAWVEAAIAVLGGTGLSNPMKTFFGIEQMRLKGERVAGGYRVRVRYPLTAS